MKIKTLSATLFLVILSFFSQAKIVQVEQNNIASDYLVQSKSPFHVGDTSPVFYVTAGIARRVLLTIRNEDGVSIFTYDYPEVKFTDTFVLDEVSYQGVTIETSELLAGEYTVSLKIYDAEKLVSSYNYDLLVDGSRPEITGDFYWDAPFQYYYDIHSDGKFIIGRSQAKLGGFASHTPGDTPVKKATFSAKYVDGDLAGTFHAKDIPASIIDGAVVIGTGAKSSISSQYIPNNTEAEMELTYTIFASSGLSHSRSERVYVDTKNSTVSPVPYGVFTGDDVELDGVTEFAGFVPYVPGMVVNTNPVRMLYRAPREAFVGGGGRADIYGGWIQANNLSRRGENGILYKDDDFIYYDVTATSSGTELDRMAVFTKDISSWRNKLFLHSLSLGPDAQPPQVIGFDMFIQGLNTWVSADASMNNRHVITKEDTNYSEDIISKIKIKVEPRNYEQRFGYSFTVYGSNVRDDCFIPPGGNECTINSNLPYPGSDLNIYHNRHRVFSVDTGMSSNEAVSHWRYDGAPAEIERVNIPNDSERFSVIVTKGYSSRVWSQSTIRKVSAYVVKLPFAGNMQTDIPDETKRIQLSLFTEGYEVVDDIIRHTAYFEYDMLTEGDYALYIYVEDGFSSSAMHTNDYFIQTLSIGDKSPPSINLNVVDGDIVYGLTGIIANLVDSNNTWVTDMLLTGGPSNINMSLPFSDRGGNQFRPEHVYIEPSNSEPYILEINAKDEFLNESHKTVQFYYVPPTITLPDVELAAVASPVRSQNGQAHNVILTSSVRDYANVPAIGNHLIYFTLMPNATESFNVNGQEVSPGQTISFNQNLSNSDGKVRLVVYPGTSGVATQADYQITIPEVKIQVCPDTFVSEGTERCVFVDIKPSTPTCSDDYELSNDKSMCNRTISYTPELSCEAGYELNTTTLTCSGFIEVAPVKTCPSLYGTISSGSCRKHETVQAEPCSNGQHEENGVCTDGNVFAEIGKYCAGLDVSNGSACDENGVCYSYEEDWNACEKVTLTSPIDKCHEGDLVDGVCRILDSYLLQGICDAGFTRVEGSCERIDFVDPTFTCTDGAQPTQDGNACQITYHVPFIGCPDGYAEQNSRCYPLSLAQASCPDDFNLGETCEKVASGLSIVACLPGFELQSNFCYQVYQPMLTCDDGSEPQQGSCMVSSSSQVNSCQDGYSLIDGLCYQRSLKVPTCGEGATLSEGVCITNNNTYSPTSCSPGYVPVQSSTQSSIGTLSNSIGSMEQQSQDDQISCHSLSQYPSFIVCPYQYIYMGNTCKLSNDFEFDPTLDPIIYLTESNYRAVCMSYRKSYSSHDSELIDCYDIVADPEGGACEGTDTLNSDGLCESSTFSQPTLNCPGGDFTSVNETECQSLNPTLSAGLCTGSGVLNLSDGRCENTTLVPAESGCSTGQSLTAYGTCRSNTPTLSAGVCDQGVLQLDGTCTITTSTDITYTCQAGQVPDSPGFCLSLTPASSVGVCQDGYDVGPIDCSLTETSSLIVNCPDDFSYEAEQCRRIQTKPISFACAPDETQLDGQCEITISESVFMNCGAPFSYIGANQCENRIEILRL